MKRFTSHDWFKAAARHGMRIAYLSFARGYVSRTQDPEEVLTSQCIRSTKDGRQYIEIPCWISTRYHYRAYLLG